MTDLENPPFSEPEPVLESTKHPTVVGIGASAGGLAALKTLVPEIPRDSGVAWVVVVHLSPEHESHLPAILQPAAHVPVCQVTETMLLEPDRVYVIPPNANLNAIDTHLRLSKLESKVGERAPIDHFFRTLSRTHEGKSIGVILTGTGSDGAQGVREIKAKGGLVLVQDPEEAEYDGMPRSALATGEVDAVLGAAEIPDAILRFIRTEPRLPKEGEGEDQRVLHRVFTEIRARTGRDFSRYKRPTMLRRIARRMQLREIEELGAYLELLKGETKEVTALADDILITVTSFFRDPEVFAALQQTVIPRLFEGRAPADCIRVWSVGCATGEEAYSLAIVLLEEAARREAPPRIQVFASDLHEHALSRARDGFYRSDITADVSAERLERFFQVESGGYRIRKQVRELVLFSGHDLLGDPPFSRIDMVACRNLLIYLQPDVQRDVLHLFHYALAPRGYLLLGPSESVDPSNLFRAEDKAHRIYRRREVPASEPRPPVFAFRRPPLTRPVGPEEVPERIAPRALHQRLVEQYASPSLLLSAEDDVIHLSDRVGRYLVHPTGEPTTDVFRLVRDELRVELRAALHAVRTEGQARDSSPVAMVLDGEPTSVVLRLRPALGPDQDGCVLVSFDERAAPQPLEAPGGHDGGGANHASLLQAELTLTRERQRAIVDEYQRSQEELRSSNEELQSSNEELRSTMEELETSKEELQSINEELQAVNQENRHRMEELAQLSSDLQNLLLATEIATLFLDRQLKILRFTPKVAELFNVRAADQGRPISDLTHRLGYPELVADARLVLERLIPMEREVADETGHWYLARVLPYRSTDDRIDGVVITFFDITDRKRMEEELRGAMTFASSIVETLHEPVLVLLPDLRVRTANPAFYAHFQVTPQQTLGRLVYELGNGQWDIPSLRTMLEQVLPERSVFNDFEVEHDFEGIGRRVIHLNARQLDGVQLILLGIRDVTAERASERELRAAKGEAELAARAKTQFLSTMSHELRTPLTAVIGISDLLETGVFGPVNDRQKLNLDRVKRSAWHLVDLIDEVLTYSRSEAGREQLRISEVDLADVARDVLIMLQAVETAPDLELRLEGADEPVPARTDTGKVRQILTNLVGNAIKYSAAPVVALELSADEEWAEFRVRDWGIGIAADRLEEIFRPFVQLDASNTREKGGAGLGLTICRRLARLLGGDVTVESRVGEGSTFTLRLPRWRQPVL